MKEAYCSYEVSKFLKKKGFDEPCLQVYTSDGKRYNMHSTCYQNVCDDDECLAPTLQMACKWLREKGYHVEIRYKKGSGYYPVIQDIDDTSNYETYVAGDLHIHEEYEDAVEEAIKYVLENLI